MDKKVGKIYDSFGPSMLKVQMRGESVARFWRPSSSALLGMNISTFNQILPYSSLPWKSGIKFKCKF